MKTPGTITPIAFTCAIAITLFTGCQSTPPVEPPPPQVQLTPDEAHQLAIDAYVYGYPLVTMEYTRRVVTNAREQTGTRVPMGQLARLRTYPTASFRDVTAPNADTLYVTGFIDVGKEPWVLTLPDAKERYYLFPMLDGWTDVIASPGTRTTGTGPQKYAITGPGWTGALPAGVREVKSPTALVWLLGRVYCTGTKDDYDAVHEMQDQISIEPLSVYDGPYHPPQHEVDTNIDMETSVRDQVNALNGEQYFSLLARLLKNNPPGAADQQIVQELAQIGVVPGQPFNITNLPPVVVTAVEDAPRAGQNRILDWSREGVKAGLVKDMNGWMYTVGTGAYGTNYLQRAYVAYVGLGANLSQDAVYPTSEVDDNHEPYIGLNKYVMHFASTNDMPPAKAFWSLTLYNDKYYFTDNTIGRYCISKRDALKVNGDGSVDIYIQNEDPGPDNRTNWLPAPEGKFVLMMRIYWPKETPPSILDSTWTIPPVKKVE